jgi:hypothetical protein
MRSAERELAEIERKKQAADFASSNSQKPKTPTEINRERIADLEKQIDAESRRLANVRAQLQRIKVGKTVEAAAVTTSTTVAAAPLKEKLGKKPKAEKAEGEKPEKKKGPSKGSTRGGNLRQVPDGLLPELCK